MELSNGKTEIINQAWETYFEEYILLSNNHMFGFLLDRDGVSDSVHQPWKG